MRFSIQRDLRNFATDNSKRRKISNPHLGSAFNPRFLCKLCYHVRQAKTQEKSSPTSKEEAQGYVRRRRSKFRQRCPPGILDRLPQAKTAKNQTFPGRSRQEGSRGENPDPQTGMGEIPVGDIHRCGHANISSPTRFEKNENERSRNMSKR